MFVDQRNETPEKVKAFRRANVYPLGKPLATRERTELCQQLQDRDLAFGDKIMGSDPAKVVMFGSPAQQPSDIIQEVKESIYKTRKTEALGKGLDRNYVFPAATMKNDFAFGVPTLGSCLKRRSHNGSNF